MPNGRIITFYSYKGGTGRTMAVANIACLLANEMRQRVLMIDWDLEAPGLHRYFRSRLNRYVVTQSNQEEQLDYFPGLIDLFVQIRDQLGTSPQPTAAPDLTSALFGKLSSFIMQTDIDGVALMKAGRFDSGYSGRINEFKWDALYAQAPWVFTEFAAQLAGMYDYVLIDSRTGLTDTSGICTTILPDQLVVVFTPNRQSLLGLNTMLQKAVDYRLKSTDERGYSVFPLVSRIEMSELQLRQEWRTSQAFGYQPLFEGLFAKLYGLDRCNLSAYFDQAQIKHVPYYAYGEEIAALREPITDVESLTAAYYRFTDLVAELEFPWDAQAEAPGVRQRSDVEERIAAKQARETLRDASLPSREYVRALYLMFDRFVHQDQQTYYRIAINRYRAASNTTSQYRVLSTLLSALAFTLVGLLVAINPGQCITGTPTGDCGLTQAVVIAAILISGTAAGLSLLFTSMIETYQHARMIELYEHSSEEMQTANALSPDFEMDDAAFLRSFTQAAEATLSVMEVETAQWGALSRDPEQYIEAADERWNSNV